MRSILTAAPLRYPASTSTTGQAGFTLLEVLVAIVVLSFGVLGVVGLQAAALQANKDARYQSTAIAMGRELADMMRGNKDLAIQNPASSPNPYIGSWAPGASGPSGGDCFAAACASQTAVANHGMREWLARVQAVLPGARVTTCFDTAPYSTTDNLPQWDCTAGTGSMAVLKIGWTRQTLNRADTGVDQVVNTATSRPTIILPLIPGNAE